MYYIAQQVQEWLDADRAVHVAQVVATRGFSTRDPAMALAWTSDAAVGALLPGLDTDLLATGGRLDGRLVEITISDGEAVAAGLVCGGDATVFVQPAAAYPAQTWARLSTREPLCLLTEIHGDAPGRTEAFTTHTVRDAATRPGAEGVARLFARGTSDSSITRRGDTTIVVTTLWPPTTLLVVGDGMIAEALAGVADLLGWTPTVTNDVTTAVAEGSLLTESDAVVVLSHDLDVGGPVLEAVLSGRTGYVGALGSRRTQAARHDWLDAHGVSAESQGRIYGPAGLDVDAHTPGELAVSIVAEILASRSGSGGGSLRERGGPVHAAGVSAPPPRYAPSRQ